MAWLTSTTIAQTWGKCPTCPYLKQCRESEFTDRPDDAWCRQKEREYAGGGADEHGNKLSVSDS